MGDGNNNIPDSRVQDTQEDFENQSQRNAGEQTDSQTAWQVNRKRTYDAYQEPDLAGIRQNQRIFEQSAASLQSQLAAVNNITVQALQNAVKVSDKIHIDAANDVVSERAAARKVADMAADGMWTDQMNPVTRGAGNDLTGQAPVNAALGSTASLYAVFGNITTGVTALAQSLAQSNVAITSTNAAMVALLAQLVENAKQPKAA